MGPLEIIEMIKTLQEASIETDALGRPHLVFPEDMDEIDVEIIVEFFITNLKQNVNWDEAPDWAMYYCPFGTFHTEEDIMKMPEDYVETLSLIKRPMKNES